MTNRSGASVAAALTLIDGVTINPAVAQTNMFHVFLEGDQEALLLERDRIAEEHELWLFGGLTRTELPHIHKFEFTVGDAALNLEVEAITSAFVALVTGLATA